MVMEFGGGCVNSIGISSDFSFIGGGCSNEICPSVIYSNIVGGCNNLSCGNYSVIVGGSSNTVSGCNSFIGNGALNCACTNYSFVGGGGTNTACGNYSVIVGGSSNTVSGNCGAILGGLCNTANGDNSFLGSGACNLICLCSTNSSIVGGCLNKISSSSPFFATNAIIGGGFCNLTCGCFSFLGGGSCNSIGNGEAITLVGGLCNVSASAYAFLGGGTRNWSAGQGASVAGGQSNCVFGNFGAILGGTGNCVCCTFGIVVGGQSNQSCGCHSAVLGGIGVCVTANCAGAFGCSVINNTACSFMSNQLIACNIFGATSICANASGVIVPVVSDCRLKTNICSLDCGINRVSLLNPVSYEWKEQEKHSGCGKQIGFIAQEVKEVVPEAVFETESGYYGFNDSPIVALLTKTVQEQEKRISVLEEIIKRNNLK